MCVSVCGSAVLHVCVCVCGSIPYRKSFKMRLCQPVQREQLQTREPETRNGGFFFYSGNFIYLSILFLRLHWSLFFLMRVPLCLSSLQRLRAVYTCLCVCVCVAYVWKGNDGSDTETGWCSSDGSLQGQAACSSSLSLRPPHPPRHGYLMARDCSEAPRLLPPARQTPHSVFPSHIAVTKTALHVSATYVASIKENIKKRVREQEPEVKVLSEDSLCAHAGNTRIKLSLRGD